MVFSRVNTLSFPLIVLDCHGESIRNSGSCCGSPKPYLRRNGLSACPHWTIELSLHRRLADIVHVGPSGRVLRTDCSTNSGVSEVNTGGFACPISGGSFGQYLHSTLNQYFGITRAIAFDG